MIMIGDTISARVAEGQKKACGDYSFNTPPCTGGELPKQRGHSSVGHTEGGVSSFIKEVKHCVIRLAENYGIQNPRIE